jgi:hypothetical protein
MKLTSFILQGSNLNIFRKQFGNNSNKKNVKRVILESNRECALALLDLI